MRLKSSHYFYIVLITFTLLFSFTSCKTETKKSAVAENEKTIYPDDVIPFMK